MRVLNGVKFLDLALFFKDSAHSKHMSLEKDYEALRVYEGKAQCFRANWKGDNTGVPEITLLLGLEVQTQVQEPR